MRIKAPKFRASHPDRELQCQESIEGVMQEIIADANMTGWGTVETMNAMEEVLSKLRLAYVEDPDPEDAVGEIEPQPHYDGPVWAPGRSISWNGPRH